MVGIELFLLLSQKHSCLLIFVALLLSTGVVFRFLPYFKTNYNPRALIFREQLLILNQSDRSIFEEIYSATPNFTTRLFPEV